MLNLSRIQLELERAKEKLRSVEEIIQKVEGKTFSNGPARYGNLKNELHFDKTRSPTVSEDGKNQKKKVISSVIDSRLQKLPSDEMTFSLKRGLREKRESSKGLKRPVGDSRPQGVFARLSGVPFQQADDEDDEEFTKKPSLQSRVITTATEVPSRQEVIAAQAVDEQSKQRNRRMFGALVGTLQKFRKEETRVREREEKKLKVEKKLEEDARREKEKLMQEKRELFMEKKRREVEIKRIEWSLNRVKEYEAWEADVIPLKNFIQTQAKPHIFYLPCVHNTKTEERLAQTKKLVDKMIEKRKTNLKEEIENSEKKARKTAAEEAEEDEAENIPEDHDHGHEEANNTEQQMQGGFEVENNENGFIVEERGKGENQMKIEKDLEETEETNKKEEKWDNVEEAEDKDTQEECMEYESERENEDTDRNLNDSKEELQLTENKNESNNVTSEEVPGDIEMSDETQLDEDQSRQSSECNTLKREENVEKRIREDEDSKVNVLNESILVPSMESTEAITNFKAPAKETKNSKEETVIENSEDEGIKTASTSADLNEKKVDESLEVPITIKKEPNSESEPKPEDSSKKTSEKRDKSGEGSRRREKSRSRKPRRRSRSPRRRSGSSRYPSRSNRRRSGSRRKRSNRKRSRSHSPAKKFRRSRSPVSKRGERSGFASKRRSPPTKSRRRNSSRSSSSASPRKRRSRSHSSTSSKSN